MMELELTTRVHAAPSHVFDVYTDHPGWQRWAGVKEVVMRRTGYPHEHGVGARRVIRARGFALEEEITHFDPPKRMAYRLIGGAPIRDHEGEVLFEPIDGGAATQVVWRIRFRSSIPLPFATRITAAILRQACQDILNRLPKACTGAA